MHGFLSSIILIVLTVSPVFASGECPQRSANRQERAAYQSAYNAAKSAIAPAPKDWILTDGTDVRDGEFMSDCPGDTNDRPRWYWLRFNYSFSSEVSESVERNAVNDALKGTPGQQAELAELERKIEDLGAARKASRSADEKSRIKEEHRAAKAEKRKIEKEITDAYMQRLMSGQLTAEIDKAKPARKDAEVIIKVNESRAWIPVLDTPVQIPGAAQAYWCRQGDNGGRLVILLGAWDAGFKAKLAGTSIATRPQNMIIEISAEKQMAENLARQIKLDLLKKQL